VLDFKQSVEAESQRNLVIRVYIKTLCKKVVEQECFSLVKLLPF